MYACVASMGTARSDDWRDQFMESLDACTHAKT